MSTLTPEERKAIIAARKPKTKLKEMKTYESSFDVGNYEQFYYK